MMLSILVVLAISSPVPKTITYPLKRTAAVTVAKACSLDFGKPLVCNFYFLIFAQHCYQQRKIMTTFLVTKPPELVVQARVRKVRVPKESHVFCDSFWACMLNDYLEDFSEDGSLRDRQRRSLPVEREQESLLRVKRKGKRRLKKRKDVIVEEVKKKIEDPLDAELDNLLSDDKITDEQRDMEILESPVEQESVQENSSRITRLKKTNNEDLLHEEESFAKDAEQKIISKQSHDRELLSRSKSITDEVVEHQETMNNDPVGEKAEFQNQASDDIQNSKNHSHHRPKTMKDKTFLKPREETKVNNPSNGDLTDDKTVEWMIRESKRAEQEYSRRRIDRKEALQRIRAIKARLHNVDP